MSGINGIALDITDAMCQYLSLVQTREELIMKKVDVLVVGLGSPCEFFKKFEEVGIMPIFLSHFPGHLKSLVLRATADSFRMIDELKEIETKVFNEISFNNFITSKNLINTSN